MTSQPDAPKNVSVQRFSVTHPPSWRMYNDGDHTIAVVQIDPMTQQLHLVAGELSDLIDVGETLQMITALQSADEAAERPTCERIATPEWAAPPDRGSWHIGERVRWYHVSYTWTLLVRLRF